MVSMYIIGKDDGFFNGRMKYIPLKDGSVCLKEVMISSDRIFNPDGLEISGKSDISLNCIEVNESGAEIDEVTEEGKIRAAKTAARKFRDIVDSTPDLCLFVTLTLSSEEMEKKSTTRYDYSGIVRTLRPWLSNHVQRHGLKYVLVPERHKDGGIHFHGFFNDIEQLKLVENERKIRSKSGGMIYNLRGYPYGFTTACFIGTDEDRLKASNYCSKYCTKNLECIGGRYYFSGGELGRPIYKYFDYPYDEALGDVYVVGNGSALKVTKVEYAENELTLLGMTSGNKFKNGTVDEHIERLWIH